MISSCVSSRYHVDKTPLDKHFDGNPVFRESHTGLVVFDPKSKEMLFDYNGQKHFTPASNTKLLTYFAAIHLVADSIPALKYCLKNDALYFTGTGDGTLLYDKFDYARTFSFLKRSSYPLVFVPRPMADVRFGPGWSWDDYPYYFSAEKSASPIYGNMLKVKKEPMSDHLAITPQFLDEELSIRHLENSSGANLQRDEHQNIFQLSLGKDAHQFEEEIPFVYSDELFVKLLADTLQRDVEMAEAFPKGHFELLNSVPTDSVSKQILIESDNFLAEQMLLIISSQLGDTLSSMKSIEFIMDNYLSELEHEIYWVDGSGLSRYNLVTPNAMVRVLEHIYHKVPKVKLYQLLPESGKSGTLKSAFANLPGHIHAKTGSMSHVYNLSGYLETKTGKTLLFSFMNNNFNVSFSELKAEMEKVLAVFVNDVK